MSIITVTRRFSFDAAHRLPQHEGKCRNLHGHRYEVDLSVEGVPGENSGMVIDFSHLTSSVGRMINDVLDHACILQRSDPLAQVLAAFVVPMRIVLMEGPPTAENMAVLLAESAVKILQAEPVRVVKVRVWETPKSFADWDADAQA